jgi:hypothetical protein
MTLSENHWDNSVFQEMKKILNEKTDEFKREEPVENKK